MFAGRFNKFILQQRKSTISFALGQLQETKSVIEHSLRLPAITEGDALSKEMLRLILPRVNAALKNHPPISPRTSSPSLEGDKYGTGFYVSGDGHIITNSHLVEGCKTIETADHIVLNIIEYNKEIDVALLQAKSFKPPSYATFRQNNAVIGESVIVFGFPLPGILSKSGNLTTGVVSATSGVGNNQRNIQISAPVQPGNSGGPLLDQSGYVIGVVVSKLNAVKVAGITGDLAQNVNFAIKSSEVLAFLGRNNVVPQFATSTENKKTEAVATLASSFTVQLICHH
jgi:S1-C subfamily serine protease